MQDTIFNHDAIFQNKEEQIVKLEDLCGKSDAYQLMARRLQEAAVDAEVRKMMKGEDVLMREYRLLKEIERRRMMAAESRGLEKGRAEEKLEMARKMKALNIPAVHIATF